MDIKGFLSEFAFVGQTGIGHRRIMNADELFGLKIGKNPIVLLDSGDSGLCFRFIQ